MIMLRSARAVARPARVAATHRRHLGDTVAGPRVADLAANAKVALRVFSRDPSSYNEFKSQCSSLRLFAFAGVSAGCVASLVYDPPKSSYWCRFGPSYWWSHLKNMFGPKPSIFLAERANHTIDVPSLVAQVIPTGRMIALEEKSENPKVLFVLGGPGAGKGTQCALIVENYKHWSHISAGDCLREERMDPNSKDGELINSIIKEGKIVPSEITVSLVKKAMDAQRKDGKTCFLIDGFPRNLGNCNAWEAVIGEKATVLGVLFYEASEIEMEKRLIGRGATSGRVDDNIESIRKRFRTYIEETKPIIERFATKGMVFSINGMPAAEEVWSKTKAVIESVQKHGN